MGRVSGVLGPTNPRWSTFSGEMTPENITQAIDLCNTGMPFLLHDMYRRAIENDAHLGGVVMQMFAGIVSRRDQVEPPPTLRRDDLAISVANWMRAVREQVEDFDQARFALLWAEGAGYSAAENVFAYRPITWYTHDGERIHRTYCVPVKLEIVDGRSFRFDTADDEPLLWLQGDYAEMPPAKFVFHECSRFSSLRERGGFMRSCLYLHAMKQWTLRDMSTYLHMYGLPQMVAEHDPRQIKYEEAKEIARTVAKYLGEGLIPTVPMQSFNLKSDTPPPQGALVHADAMKVLNEELTKRVTLGVLTMGGGTGFGTADLQGDSAHDGRVLAGNNLCATLRKHLWRPTLALNAVRLALDLSQRPDAIMAVLPEYHCRIQRDDTPEKRQAIFSQAMRDGLPVSRTQYRGDLHLDEPVSDEDVLKGEATPIPSAGATASAVDASQGLMAPEQPNGGGDRPAAETQDGRI